MNSFLGSNTNISDISTETTLKKIEDDLANGVIDVGIDEADITGQLPINIVEVNGNTVDVGNGASGTGTLRVAVINNNDDIPVKLNSINGEPNIAVDIGNSSASTQRVVLATDQPAVSITSSGNLDINLVQVNSSAVVNTDSSLQVTLNNNEDNKTSRHPYRGGGLYGDYLGVKMNTLFENYFTYSINPRIWDIDLNGGTSTIAHSFGKATLLHIANENSPVNLLSKHILQHRAGQVSIMKCAVSVESQADNSNANVGIAWGFGRRPEASDMVRDGFGFGIGDTTLFTWHNTNNNNFENRVFLASWNGEPITIIPGDINEYMVKFIPSHRIEWFIMDKLTNRYILVHSENTSTVEMQRFPNMSAYFGTRTIGSQLSTTNMELDVFSASLSIEGDNSITFPARSIEASAVGIMASTVAINIRNIDSYNTFTNQNALYLDEIHIAVENNGANTSILKVFENAVITAPTYVNEEATVSIIEKDLVGTITGGRLIYSIPLESSGDAVVSNLMIYVPPLGELSFEITPNAGTLAYDLGLIFKEDL